MLFFKIESDERTFGKVTAVADEYPKGDDRALWTSRNELKSFEDAERLAKFASEDLGETFIAVDKGGYTSPRYDVVRAPKVGDPVSYGFNGDYYPDGHISKIGGTNFSRIYTDTGSVYNRRRQTGSWVKRGGTWSMVRGHHDERNPHI